MKKFIGFLLVFVIIGGLFIATCVIYGIKEASIVWGISLIITIILVFGISLLTDNNL